MNAYQTESACSRFRLCGAPYQFADPDRSPRLTPFLVHSEYQHSVFFGKLAYTKSILHTGKKRTGWSIPGAHFLRNPHATAARIVTPNGHLVDTVHYGRNAEEGLQYEGKFTGGRIFEPLVLYHYVQRGELWKPSGI